MSKRKAFYCLGGWVVAGTVLGVSRGVEAADPGEVAIQVWVIRATQSNSRISPRLKPLAEKLKKSFKFTGYELSGTKSETVRVGKPMRGDLLGPYKLSVTPQSRTKGHVELKIAVTKRKGNKDINMLNTSVRLAVGRFQLLGGWRLGDGEVLIVAVSGK